MDINEVSGDIVNAAMKVHSALGPGLLESAYQACLSHELRNRGRNVVTELVQPVFDDGLEIDAGYRIDMLVDGCVIVEIKAVEKLAPIHEAQLLTYMKLSDTRIDLLINFNVMHLKDGIKRMANKA